MNEISTLPQNSEYRIPSAPSEEQTFWKKRLVLYLVGPIAPMAITWIAFAAFPPTAPLAAGIAVIAFTIAVVSIVMTTPDSEADLLSDNIQKIFKKIVSKPSEPLAHEQYFLPLAEQQAPLPVAEQQAPLPVAEDPRIYLAAPRYKDPIRKEFQPKQITSLRLLGDLHDHRR